MSQQSSQYGIFQISGGIIGHPPLFFKISSSYLKISTKYDYLQSRV